MTLAAKLEDVRFYARQEGIEKGTYDTKVGMAKKLLARGLPAEEIADICGLDVSEIKKIAEDV